MEQNILTKNRDYWTKRAPGYSLVNRDELYGEQKKHWMQLLQKEIECVYPDRNHHEIQILDIGCGPGFFSIILTEMGFSVTAIDFADAMILEAKKNAGKLAENISFMRMNAEELTFSDDVFDVVISRNLTWNLKHPERAYEQWCRVLKRDGLLLNFDANWYHYMFDDVKKDEFFLNREKLVRDGYDDYCAVTDEDAMEEIVRELPMGRINRPKWDEEVLRKLRVHVVDAEWDIARDIWSEEEKKNYALTPMFMIRAIK